MGQAAQVLNGVTEKFSRTVVDETQADHLLSPRAVPIAATNNVGLVISNAAVVHACYFYSVSRLYSKQYIINSATLQEGLKSMGLSIYVRSAFI